MAAAVMRSSSAFSALFGLSTVCQRRRTLRERQVQPIYFLVVEQVISLARITATAHLIVRQISGKAANEGIAMASLQSAAEASSPHVR
jgi:hypothetical protein